MASLPSIRFGFKSKAGDELDFKSAVTVGADGLFTMTIPVELEDALRGVCKGLRDDGSGVYDTPKSIRVYAPSLQQCKDLIGKAGEEWAACQITEEAVIVYARDIKVAYCIDTDGAIYGNGCGLHGYRRGGELHATNRAKFYTVGFAAKCMLKITYVRASSSKIEYKQSPHKTPHHLDFPETYHDKLNGFNCLSIGDPRYMQEMPYTEEAAKFFYEMMAGICALADRVEQFFGNTENVINAIAQGKSPLALPGSRLQQNS